ncbi:glycoside hydrolase family 32 protein [Foetidibacter luteolus]|uniref:glycoside hydrolase family 32 protein n=1 Tax=Foetidibacter luteolus TaxID=2608880 RepID=UPI00129AD632|nr:glycoside hydrolase family 32 protein [Foetidibacter luteolus]
MKRLLLFCAGLLFAVLTTTAQETKDTLTIKPGDIEASRRVRRAELDDAIRPAWHLTIAEGQGMPFDPNGAIFKDGVYHLWHLYQAEAGHHWQHLSSIDLFHWRWHSKDLQHHTGDPDKGIFSGNAFVAKDGNVVISYHGVESGGNCVAYSSDKNLDIWQKPKANPIATPGWDPHMWLEGDTYYQISGGMPVSAGIPNPAVLFTGKSYTEPMKKLGNFLKYDLPGVDDFEDISCPDFFKLDDKWVLVCISHIRGARYYIGNWDGQQFTPEYHHRMNWPGGTFFAPETLLDDKGRRILWAWVLDRKSGVSSGTMSMPRVLTLAKDKKSLLIEPPQEVERLRYQPASEAGFEIGKGQTVTLKNTAGKSMEIEMVVDPGLAKRFGFNVFCSADGREKTAVVFDRDKKTLGINVDQSSLQKSVYREFAMVREPNPAVDIEEAPFEILPGEKLKIRAFLDKSVLEVFVNGRQCITQVVYPTLKDAVHVEIFAEDATVKAESVKSWQLFPAMQW